jgi:hypothetical protein
MWARLFRELVPDARRQLPVLTRPNGAGVQPPVEVRLLGQRLHQRCEEVVQQTAARSRASGPLLTDAVEAQLQRVGETSTIALAGWMAGNSAEAAMQVGQETWQTLGGMAARGALPLNEVAKRCWRWRDSVRGVLTDSARHTDLSAASLSRALEMLDLVLQLTIAGVCERFDSQRLLGDEQSARGQQALSFMRQTMR